MCTKLLVCDCDVCVSTAGTFLRHQELLEVVSVILPPKDPCSQGGTVQKYRNCIGGGACSAEHF